MQNRRYILAGFLVLIVGVAGLLGWQRYQAVVYKQYLSDARKAIANRQYKDARELAQQAIDINVSDHEPWRVLASAAYESNDHTTAIAAFKQVRELTYDEQKQLLQALAITGDYAGAATLWRDFDKSIIDRTAAIEQFFHVVREKNPMFDDGLFARHLLDEWSVPYPSLLEKLGRQDLAIHDVASAKNYWSKLLRVYPTNEMVMNNLTALYLRSGETARAKEVVKPFASPQAEWLRSRIHLAEGNWPKFKEATALAHKAGVKFGTQVEPARFVGSAACSECHPTHATGQAKTHHAMTLGFVRVDQDPELKQTAIISDNLDQKFKHQIRHESGKYFAKVWSNDHDAKELELIYRIGSGLHGVTYLGRDANQRWFEYRISKYHGINPPWDVTTGQSEFDSVHRAEGKFVTDLSQRECLRCHSTNTFAALDYENPPQADVGIRCEVCHGPGENHIKLARAELLAVDPGLRNPKRMSAADSVAVCGSCHKPQGAEPTPEVLARPSTVRFQALGLTASKCFTESGKLRCTTCHNPHRSTPVTIDEHVANCRKCHPASKPLSCPTDATKNCITCHMPRVEGMRHSFFADHFIRVIQP